METTKLLGPNTQKYKLAGTGAGVIVCQQRSRHSFRALLSMREQSVGLGLGITGGGFVENGNIFKLSPGFIVETAAEAWRETREENLGFDNLFTCDEFIERAQSVSTMHVRVDDENGVHGTNYYALTVTDEEWDSVASLPPGPEREGPLMEVWVTFDRKLLTRRRPEREITLALSGGRPLLEGRFYHQHELRAIGQIAWHVQQDLLWPPLT